MPFIPKVFVILRSEETKEHRSVLIDELIEIDPIGAAALRADLHRSSDSYQAEEMRVSATRIPGQFRITGTPFVIHR